MRNGIVPVYTECYQDVRRRIRHENLSKLHQFTAYVPSVPVNCGLPNDIRQDLDKTDGQVSDGQVHDEKVHPGLAVLGERQSHENRAVPDDDHGEHHPQERQRFHLTSQHYCTEQAHTK